MAASVMVSTWSGIWRTSRSARLAVTLTCALSPPSSSTTGTSSVASLPGTITVRAASEKPLRVTITRYEPAAVTSNV